MHLHFLGPERSCLNTRPLAQYLLRDPGPEGLGSVNAMKQTFVIVILAYYTFFNQVRTANVACNQNIHFRTLDLSKQNGISCKPTNVITSSRCHRRGQRIQNKIIVVRSILRYFGQTRNKLHQKLSLHFCEGKLFLCNIQKVGQIRRM